MDGAVVKSRKVHLGMRTVNLLSTVGWSIFEMNGQILSKIPSMKILTWCHCVGTNWDWESQYPTRWHWLSAISSRHNQFWPSTNQSHNDVKTQLMYLDQLNHSHSTSHSPVMRTVIPSINKPSTSVDTPAQALTPTIVQNYNPIFLSLQQGQCAMCGQMKYTHPEGCPQSEKLSALDATDPIMLHCSVSALKRIV